MTNLEWLMQDKELLKTVLVRGLAVCKGKQTICAKIDCKSCDFNVQYGYCTEQRKKWLEAEYDELESEVEE